MARKALRHILDAIRTSGEDTPLCTNSGVVAHIYYITSGIKGSDHVSNWFR